jgi:hypothetical protein
MNLGPLLGLFGLVVVAFAGFWYFQAVRVAAKFGQTCMDSDIHRMALIFGGIGSALIVAGLAVSLLSKDHHG